MALYYLPQYKLTTLSKAGGLTDAETAGIVFASVDGIDITKPGVGLLTYSDPLNTAVAEWFTFTSINGSNEAQGVTRGAEGSSAKAHLNGCSIAFPISKSHINNINDLLTGASPGIRIAPRIVTAASYTTDTGTSLSVATADEFDVTAQAGALKFNNPGGTPVAGQKLIIRIKDNATPSALTYDTQFRSVGATLPTTTVASKITYIGLIFNATDTKWDCIAVSTEA